MAFEKEIKEAQKICEKWMKRSVDDMNTLMGMKKNGLAWEKDNIAVIEGMINAKENQKAANAIDDARIWINKYNDEAESIYSKHHAFVMGDPRAGTKGICSAIGLKDPKNPAYIAVTKAMDKELISQTKQFKDAEGLYTNDIKPKVQVMLSKLDTLEKLALGEESKLVAYNKQFAKDSQAYLDSMALAISALKASMAERIISEIGTDPARWVSGVAKSRTDNYRIMAARVESIPKVIALADKNYGRVIKSLPAELHKQFIFAGPLKAFATKHAGILKELNEAEAKFKMAMAMIKQNFPEATL